MQRSLLGVWLVLLIVAPIVIVAADHTSGTIYVDASSPASEDTDGDLHYATLTAALAGAEAEHLANTTILIAPGTYEVQTMSVRLPGLVFESTAGPEKTVLHGGIELLAKNIVLQGLTIDAQGQPRGVLVAGPRAKLWQSVVFGAQEVGVLIQSGDETEVDSSEVRGNSIGIAVRSGSGARISRSRITGNVSAGVVVQRPAIGVTLSQNSISLNQGAGISVEGARASVILENEIRSNGLGLRLTGAQDTYFAENTIAANRGPGLFLVNSQGNEIIRNFIQDNETSGIVLQGSASNTIEANQISGHSRESGIELNSDSEANQIVRNRIEKNRLGIWFNPTPIEETEDHPRANEIAFNQIHENEMGVEIDVSDGSNAFNENDISTNQTDGIHFAVAKSERIAKNKLEHNGRVGLWMEKSQHSVISGNEIASNGAEGVKSTASEDDLFEKNQISDNALGFVLFDAKNTELKENFISKNLSEGVRVSGSVGVSFTQNEMAENRAIGVSLTDSQRVDFVENKWMNNRAGGISVSNSQIIDFEDNDFLSNAEFGLKADESAKDVTARRNFWGSALGPSNFVLDTTQTGSDKAEGFSQDVVFPWLPAPHNALVGFTTQGTMWANETGEISFEAERAGLRVTLSPEAAGATGSLVIARRLGPPTSAPKLENSFSFWSVQLSAIQSESQSTKAEALLEAAYSDEELPSGTDKSMLHLFLLKENSWQPLESKVLAEQNRVVASTSTASLKDATLALALYKGNFTVTEERDKKTPTSPQPMDSVPSASKEERVPEQPQNTQTQKEQDKQSDAPVAQPSHASQSKEKRAEKTQTIATAVTFNPYKSRVQIYHKGVMERIAEIIQAVLRLDFARAWRGVVALTHEEKPEQLSVAVAGGSQKAFRK
ncbi:right-handed parallel beta-helix repeat-containing protein [Candidatus Acetothermia bacterium]|nr:right-handed parallel beta-helix repeat-containing protein [Candidatus Acetothermia bacterium]